MNKPQFCFRCSIVIFNDAYLNHVSTMVIILAHKMQHHISWYILYSVVRGNSLFNLLILVVLLTVTVKISFHKYLHFNNTLITTQDFPHFLVKKNYKITKTIWNIITNKVFTDVSENAKNFVFCITTFVSLRGHRWVAPDLVFYLLSPC